MNSPKIERSKTLVPAWGFGPWLGWLEWLWAQTGEQKVYVQDGFFGCTSGTWMAGRWAQLGRATGVPSGGLPSIVFSGYQALCIMAHSQECSKDQGYQHGAFWASFRSYGAALAVRSTIQSCHRPPPPHTHTPDLKEGDIDCLVEKNVKKFCPFFSALLKCNLQTIKPIHYNCAIWWLWLIIWSCNYQQSQDIEQFPCLKTFSCALLQPCFF